MNNTGLPAQSTLASGAGLLSFMTLALLFMGPTLRAAEYHVSPDGHSKAAGTRAHPWSLESALEKTSVIKPGDTVWVHDGTYTGSFYSYLKGTADAPIVVRQAPGERAVLDLQPPRDGGGTAAFGVEGAHTWFWGFEVMCSDARRVTAQSGSNPPDINRGSIICRGQHIKFINLVVHDLSQGFAFWAEGEGGEIAGCLIFNNGWRGPDRGHGHAIYTQNKSGTKRLVDNVLFNQFGYGVHAYGSDQAHLEGFELIGNVAFNNGLLSGPANRSANILIGGGSRARRIVVSNNFTYHTGLAATTCQLGYGADNADLLFQDNYFAGKTVLSFWNTPTVLSNTFIGAGAFVRYEPPRKEPAAPTWDQNRYYSPAPDPQPFSMPGGWIDRPKPFETWQKLTRFDTHSQLLPWPPPDQVFVRPNPYEPGRAHIVVYNWSRQPSVTVNLAGILSSGQSYSIQAAQDYFGTPLKHGVYDGQPISLPMSPHPSAPPLGMTSDAAPPTTPEFDVFIVLPHKE